MKAKYYIYRNLNKGHYFSIKHKGIVIDRSEFILAVGCTMKVSEAGRNRCLKQKKRNVHAYVACNDYHLLKHDDLIHKVDSLTELKYNPYTSGHFMADGKIVEEARHVFFIDGKAYI